jgi:hypothetical protein
MDEESKENILSDPIDDQEYQPRTPTTANDQNQLPHCSQRNRRSSQHVLTTQQSQNTQQQHTPQQHSAQPNQQQ